MSNELPFRLDPFFQSYCGAHPDPAALEQAILADGRVIDPVIVWLEQGVLVDGYTRARIHADLTAKGVQLGALPVFARSFADQHEAALYVLTRQSSLRQMNPNKRAWLWLENHSTDIEQLRNRARRNQADAGGDKSLAADEALLAHAPKAEPLNVRKLIAAEAKVSEAIVGAAMRLRRFLIERPNHPRHAAVVSARNAFIAQEFTYRDLHYYLDKFDAREHADSEREQILAQPLPRDGSDSGPVVMEVQTPSTTPTPATAEMPDAVEGSKAGTVGEVSTPAQGPASPPPVPLDSLVTGDSLEVLQGVADNSVSLFFTSPPYPIRNYLYNGRNHYEGEYADYLDWLERVFTQCYRAQKPGGKFALQIDEVSAKHGPTGKMVTLPIIADLIHRMQRIGYEYALSGPSCVGG